MAVDTHGWDRASLAKRIEHTLLKPQATPAEVERLCDEAKAYGFGAVVVNPWHVRAAARALAGTGIAVATVVGFPLGATTTGTKVYETIEAVQAGATHVDMVMNIGALKTGMVDEVQRDIAAVVAAARGAGVPGPVVVKVILETGLLTDEEKVLACRLARAAGADYVKTATGFGPGGATVEDVRLMRAAVGSEMGVKAAGGIRTGAQALAMLAAGADRLGASAGVAIVEELWPSTAPKA